MVGKFTPATGSIGNSEKTDLKSVEFDTNTGELSVKTEDNDFVTNLDGRYAPENHTHDWEDITNKPTDLATTQHVDNQIDKIQMGGRNLVRNSQINETRNWYGFGGRTVQLEAGKTYTFSVNGRCNNVSEGKTLASFIYNSDWSWARHIRIDTITDTTGHTTFEAPATGSFAISHYYYDASNPREGSVTVNWVKLERGNKATDWSPAPEDIQEQIKALEDEVHQLKYATEHTDNVLNINNSHIGRTIYYKGSTNLTINVANMKKDATFSVVKTHPTAKILFTGKTIVADNGGITGGAYSSASVVCLGNEVVVLASNRS